MNIWLANKFEAYGNNNVPEPINRRIYTKESTLREIVI
jgi:hypothetical protein